MRNVAVALFLCFILLFAALWYRHVLPAAIYRNPVYSPPTAIRNPVYSPAGGGGAMNEIVPHAKSRERQKIQKEKSKKFPWPTLAMTPFAAAKGTSPGDEVVRGTEIPRAVSPWMKNRNVSKMMLSVAKNEMLTSSMVVTTTTQKSKAVLLLFWSTWFGKRLDLHESWTKKECPVECYVTSDLSRADHASAFIVHARDPYPLPPRDDVPWILYTQENPVYTEVLRQASYMSKFQLLKSYRLDSDFPDPTFTVPNFDPPLPFHNKTGFIMAAFSNCEHVRMEYMRQLMRFVKVDSYGACHKNTPGLVRIYSTDDYREQKTELARKYKFLLVFFNQDCDYFVDDQLLHALNAGVVPVVMGTDKIGEFMPGNLRDAYVNVRNFTSPKRLAEYLTFLGNNETEYNKYLEWKFKGFGDIDGTVIGKHFHPAYPPYCQVCVAVAERKVHEEGLRPDLCAERKFEDWNIKPPWG